MQFDVLIIGAGAAGLMAMKKLTNAGHRVCMLEAGANIGGRCATYLEPGFQQLAESGAEFLHGEPPLTLELLKDGGIGFEKIGGSMINVQNSVWLKEDQQSGQFDKVNEKLSELKTDLTVKDFLDNCFPAAEYESLHQSVQKFSEGFGLADISNASSLALKEEWKKQDEDQYRIRGGYTQLIDHLFSQCNTKQNPIIFYSPVYKIEWKKGRVRAYTSHGFEYSASKLIITASAGVLKAGNIKINLAAEQEAAIDQLGFGSVIKLFFSFKDAFWLEKKEDLSFLLTDEKIPTWWTQFPAKKPLLTGWLGGPEARIASTLPGNELYEMALTSLSNIFGHSSSVIRNMLTHHKIICWDTVTHVKGGYSYSTLESSKAIDSLSLPIEETIYFAGEAIYTGKYPGTVEAALQSGKNAAEKIIGGY